MFGTKGGKMYAKWCLTHDYRLKFRLFSNKIIIMYIDVNAIFYKLKKIDLEKFYWA